MHIPKDERPKLDAKSPRLNNAYSWVIAMTHLGTDYGIMLVRRSSEAKMWYSLRTKLSMIMMKVRRQTNNIVSSSYVYENHGGEVAMDDGDANQNNGEVQQDEEVEQEEQTPPKPQLMRSTKQKQPSKRYSPDKYVMFPYVGELGNY